MARILLVDDCASDRVAVCAVLAQRPHWVVDEAEDGSQALARMAVQRPDVVLTDLQMPGLDGWQLVERVRDEFPGLPVVLITGQGSEEIAMRALRAGAAAYVPKRLLATELVDTLDRVIDLAQEERNYYTLLRQLEQLRWRVTLPNDLDMIRALVSFVKRQLHEMRVGDDTEQFRIAMALEEALSNAYYHGNLELDSHIREQDIDAFDRLGEQRRQEFPYSERKITVLAKIGPEQVQFIVRDDGPGFDPSALPDPTNPESLNKPSGRGILLMRAFMDDVRFMGRGNAVCLRRRIGQHSGCQDANGDEQE